MTYATLIAFTTLAQAAQPETGGTNPLISVAAFLLMLFILVLVHELGHFLSAVWMGIRVEEFGIGYPPRAATVFTHKGVKFTLNWLPLGGFVRFATEDGSKDNLYGAGGSIANAHPLRKIIVMVAGPLMNLLLAIVIFATIFALNGIPEPTGNVLLGQVYPNTPAATAGLQDGDVIVSIDGRSAGTEGIVAQVAEMRTGQNVPLEVVRNGEPLALTIVPGPWVTPSGEQIEAGFGFSYNNEVALVSANPWTALVMGTTYTWDLLGQMFRGLAALPAALGQMFSSTPNGEGPIGPVGIARATGEVIQQENGMLAFWNLTAVLSLNLFLLNLLPIPALDGSHIVFATIELLRGKRVPADKEAIVHAIGFMALMTLMLLVTVNDVMRAFSGAPVLGS